MKPLAWLFLAASAMGVRIRPLHVRFPFTKQAHALVGAKALQIERVSLV